MSVQLSKIILYSLIILFDVIGVCATIFLFGIMLLRRSLIKTDKISYLLTANNYIAFLVGSPLFIDMFINSIYGQLYSNSSFDGEQCRVKSYALYICGCAYFYSFLLQAIYRLCRIVYPTRVGLQSFHSFVMLSVAQWILAASMLLPSFLLGDMKYLPDDYHCQFAPTDVRGSLIGLSVLFLIPFLLTLICYFYTMHHVRTRTTALTTINQDTSIRRDLIILSRLLFLFTFLTTVGLPHVLIPIVYAMTGYLSSWVVPFEWLLTVFSLAAACIVQIFMSPHVKKLLDWPVQGHKLVSEPGLVSSLGTSKSPSRGNVASSFI
jgi:hypothetical protein